jgi:hypothetical protein
LWETAKLSIHLAERLVQVTLGFGILIQRCRLTNTAVEQRYYTKRIGRTWDLSLLARNPENPCENKENHLRLIFSRYFLLLAATIFVVSAQAQTDDEMQPDATSGPFMAFQDATITSSSNTVVASRVPVLSSKGTINYQDVTLVFTIGSTGLLTLASPPKVTPSQNLITAGFKSGTYLGPGTVLNGNAKITVSGPGVAPGNATEWTLTAAAGANVCTFSTSATWYVSSSLATSPLAARLRAAGITSTAYSYGIVGSAACVIDNTWAADSLI